MTNSAEPLARLAALRTSVREAADAEPLADLVSVLSDLELESFAAIAAELAHASEVIRLAAIAAIHSRSAREAGHAGFAQSRGHRNTVSLVQQLTGVTRGEATKLVRVSEAAFGTSSPEPVSIPGAAIGTPTDVADTTLVEPPFDWTAPLNHALRSGKLSTAQHDAIARGLGEPPVDRDTSARVGGAQGDTSEPGLAVLHAWSVAAEELAREAAEFPVEELAKQARAIRDLLDPEGAEARFLERYEQRSFRMWTDRDGLAHGSFVFDDESAAWLRSVLDTALRPRRGGPRFVAVDEQEAAKSLLDDPRSNEQLSHDLLMDVLKAGSTADAKAVFGARQAGVRVVQVVDREAYLAQREFARQLADRVDSSGSTLAASGVAGGAARGAERGDARGAADGVSDGPTGPVVQIHTRFEDGSAPLPTAFADQQRCNTGEVPVIADRAGNPLDVGREQRLYTPKQRIALAVRDGGCRWNGCDRPASFCEAHHIDEWAADEGRTDIDRGILLCRFHHLQLHHRGWRITRDGLGPFRLHPPRTLTSTPPTSSPPIPSPPIPSLPTSSLPTSSLPSRSAESVESLTPAEGPEPITLREPIALRYAWQHAEPPPRQFLPAA